MSLELTINALCVSCDICKLFCPENSIIKHEQIYSIDPWTCTLCDICQNVCPVDCIKMSTSESIT